MHVQPALRCRGRGLSPAILRCGRPATRKGLDADGRTLAYFCDRCTLPGDAPIGRVTTVREIRVSCEIVFAGVSLDDKTARDEAIKTLELAIGIAGGRVTVLSVSASLNQHYPGAAAALPRGERGEG